MLDGLIITEAEAAGLSRLAALDLAMAEDFAARAQAAEDPDTANDLARSYQRMARSYRQSLALKVRLQREIARAEREALEGQPPAPPVPRDEARIDARVEDLRGPIQRVIWAEHEPDDSATPDEDLSGYFFDLLEERLHLYSRDDRFGLEPLDEHIVKVCAAMTLSVALARRWRELPDPPDEAFQDPDAETEPLPAWRGSG